MDDGIYVSNTSVSSLFGFNLYILEDTMVCMRWILKAAIEHVQLSFQENTLNRLLLLDAYRMMVVTMRLPN